MARDHCFYMFLQNSLISYLPLLDILCILTSHFLSYSPTVLGLSTLSQQGSSPFQRPALSTSSALMWWGCASHWYTHILCLSLSFHAPSLLLCSCPVTAGHIQLSVLSILILSGLCILVSFIMRYAFSRNYAVYTHFILCSKVIACFGIIGIQVIKN